MQRIIGTFRGTSKGALVIAFGAVHGNETAGANALREVFNLLEKERTENPSMEFNGQLIGVIGNLQAWQRGQRYIRQDLNRMWKPEIIDAVLKSPAGTRTAEDVEISALHHLIVSAVRKFHPETLILLDLHTTSADGGIFCIPSSDPHSLQLAKALHAPVVLGLLDGIGGTLLHYSADGHFCPEPGKMPCAGIAFEGGQHTDPLSVVRCTAAVFNCLQAAGCIQSVDFANLHDQILLQYSKELPEVCQLTYVHPVKPEDVFRMRPGYVNFQLIQKGEHLADDICGPILAPESGRILMPLYQPQGVDGFFIIKDLEKNN